MNRLTFLRTLAVISLTFPWHLSARAGDPWDLPDLQTEQGTLIRLLLVESRTPKNPKYKAAEVLKGMQAMKAVIANRLSNKPGRFGAPNAKNWRDIIVAPSQFQGFSRGADGAVVMSAAVSGLLNDIIAAAKKELGPGYGPFVEFIQNAKTVASSDVADPFANLPATIDGHAVERGGYGWMTEGPDEPGGDFVKIPDGNGGLIQNNRFFTVTR